MSERRPFRPRSRERGPRPTTVFDTGLQHERTSLAWERTAISMIVAGLVLSRFAATEGMLILALGGMAEVVFGAALLVWAGVHYEDLHGPLRAGNDVVHQSAARWVGLATIGGTGAALGAAVVATIAR
jgi:uncharacterized membrane protein YidH (DUF202 family)